MDQVGLEYSEGEAYYRLAFRASGEEAADVILVVDESGSLDAMTHWISLVSSPTLISNQSPSGNQGHTQHRSAIAHAPPLDIARTYAHRSRSERQTYT